MSIWVEIHCDSQTAGSDPCGHPLCFAQNGHQPGAMAKGISTAPSALGGLKRQALREGWLLKSGKWTCPACKRFNAGDKPPQVGLD